jgi:hypothetical protein
LEFFEGGLIQAALFVWLQSGLVLILPHDGKPGQGVSDGSVFNIGSLGSLSKAPAAVALARSGEPRKDWRAPKAGALPSGLVEREASWTAAVLCRFRHLIMHPFHAKAATHKDAR